MNTTLIWIILPVIAAGSTLFLTRYRTALKWGGAGFGGVLVTSAVLLPVNEEFRMIFWNLKITDELLVFGRRFVLSSADRPVVMILFSLWLLWMLVVDFDTVPVQFVPLSLVGICLILTAYAVEPIFYGALFFAFLALIFVVLLSPPGEEPTPGALRFLIFQILGVLFILFASWLASWIDLNSGDQVMLSRSLLILALGFSFILSIFPFISWISMVAEENHPFLTGFLFNSYFFGAFLFGIRFIVEGGWISQGGDIQAALQVAGVIMLGAGGFMAIFSNHAGRLVAGAVIAEIGRSLLAISLFRTGFPIYFAMVFIQSISITLVSASLSYLSRGVSGFDYQHLAGAARSWPLISSGLLLGYFALAGLPLLAGFPIYWALGSGLSFFPVWINIVYIFSILSLLIGGLRLLGVLTRYAGEESVLTLDNPTARIMILILNGVLLLLGLMPQVTLLITQRISTILLGS